MFDIQKFASGGNTITSDGGWYHCQNQTTFFNIPEGTEFNEDDSGMGAGCIHENDPGDDVTATFAIEGVSNATGDSQTVTVTLSGELSAVTVYDSGSFISDIITVTGGNKANLTVVVGGTNYSVGTDGKLTEATAPAAEVVISSSIANTLQRPNGKKITQNIPYINPNAADSDVATFMAALNNLSDNTTVAGGIVRVDKHVIG